jgi:hypothetical protein
VASNIVRLEPTSTEDEALRVAEQVHDEALRVAEEVADTERERAEALRSATVKRAAVIRAATVARRRRGTEAPAPALAGGLVGRVFNDGDDSARHKPGRAHRSTGAGELGDFNRSAHVGDVYPAAGPGRGDLEALHAFSDVHQDFHPITPHHQER